MNMPDPDRLAFSQLLPRSKAPKYRLRAVLLIALAVAAFIDFFVSGLARRTFVFYDFDSGAVSVEERMLVSERGLVSGEDRVLSREVDITRYVEEALLGPASPNSLPLFPGETRLLSLLYRDGIVYANLSKEAALPPAKGGEVLKNLRTLRLGIRRNFSFVNAVRFFIDGKAVYRDELRRNDDSGFLEGRL
jgi:hypothetical protein